MARGLQVLALLATSAWGNYVTLPDRYTADPAPFVYQGRVYIYTSHDIANQTYWDMVDYSLMSSDDLTNWRDEGIVFDVNADSTWGQYAWAQQVIQGEDGNFYMYWPGIHNRTNTTCGSGVGVAVSSSLHGPFVDSGLPLTQGGDDPTVFRDDDGQVYFCVNFGSGPLCTKLATNMTSFQSTPVGLNPPLPMWYEAPWLSKWNSTDGNSTYYLSYMCRGNGLGNFSHYGFDICYGSCSGPQCSPLGPYVYRGVVMWNPPNDCTLVNSTCADPRNATGANNHQGIFEFPAGSHRLWFAYHSHTLSMSRNAFIGFQRNVGVDRLYSLGDVGTYPLPPVAWAVNDTVPGAGPGLLPVTATPSWVRQVKYVDAFSTVPALLSAGMSSGLDSEPCSEGGLNLGFISNGAWSMLRGVDFGLGAAAAIVRVASPLSGGAITFIADGTVIATCYVPNTGDWQTWVNTSCPLELPVQVGVVANLTLLFTGTASDGLFNVQYFTFSPSAGGGPAPVPAIPPPVTVSIALRSTATGLYWVSDSSGVITASGSNSSAAVWMLSDQEDGTYTLGANGKLACATSTVVTLNDTTPATPCTRFWLYGTTTGSYGILAVNGLFVTASSADAPLAASSADPRNVTGDGARHWLEQQA